MVRSHPHVLLVAFVAMMAIPVSAEEPNVSELLERAIYQEQAVGDLDAALKIYRHIVKVHEQNERVAAEAQLHIALIQLKRGQHQQASKVLETLAGRFPGQQQLMRQTLVDMPPVVHEAMEHIRANYVDEMVDDAELAKAALRGVVGNLDRFSSYLDADTLEALTIGTTGKVVGIGAVIDFRDGRVVVQAPIPGSPAEEAGLKPGDAIVAIDGVKVGRFDSGDRLTEALRRMRGKSGAPVTLETISIGEGQSATVKIVRREIRLDSVVGLQRDENDQWVHRPTGEPGIGYVRIRSFTKNTSEEFRRVVTGLEEDGIKTLILDLRDNGGGLMDAAIDVADMFLTEGLILDVRGRKNRNHSFSADTDELLHDIPLAIMVNRNTASAAEIVAGALQERGRATVFGERTVGKGTVQALFPLQSGGAIKLTTARYYLPDGTSLERPRVSDENATWGVDPSEGHEIAFTEEEIQAFEKHRRRIDIFGRPDPEEPAYDDRALTQAIEFAKAQ